MARRTFYFTPAYTWLCANRRWNQRNATGIGPEVIRAAASTMLRSTPAAVEASTDSPAATGLAAALLHGGDSLHGPTQSLVCFK